MVARGPAANDWTKMEPLKRRAHTSGRHSTAATARPTSNSKIPLQSMAAPDPSRGPGPPGCSPASTQRPGFRGAAPIDKDAALRVVHQYCHRHLHHRHIMALMTEQTQKVLNVAPLQILDHNHVYLGRPPMRTWLCPLKNVIILSKTEICRIWICARISSKITIVYCISNIASN